MSNFDLAWIIISDEIISGIWGLTGGPKAVMLGVQAPGVSQGALVEAGEHASDEEINLMMKVLHEVVRNLRPWYWAIGTSIDSAQYRAIEKRLLQEAKAYCGSYLSLS